MAHKLLKEKAIIMRQSGMSYSQIKEKINVSKGTLSSWLENYPLSTERLRELRDVNPRRIESYRATMKHKRDSRIEFQEQLAKIDLGKLSKRELFVSGFFLFWGEGSKTRRPELSLANTDPSMILFFVQWILLLGAQKEKIRFLLHLYEDMDTQKELVFWSKTLGFPQKAFYNPHIKKTKFADITYGNGFGHGTCNVRYASQEFNDYVLGGLRQIKNLYTPK